MFCKNCGKELPDYANVCDECGTQVMPQTIVKGQDKSTPCLVLGIIGLVVCWIMPLLGYAVGIPGLVLSIKGFKNTANNKTKVTLGLVFSIICLVISVVIHIINTIYIMGDIM